MSWRLIIEGDGPMPRVTTSDALQPGPPGPVVVMPTGPEGPPEDTSPFVFPTDGPTYAYRDGDRYYPLDTKPPGSEFYAAERAAGNPLQGSHRNAGIIAGGGHTAYNRNVEGLRLWVRADAAPALIRRGLALGRL